MQIPSGYLAFLAQNVDKSLGSGTAMVCFIKHANSARKNVHRYKFAR